MIDTLSKARAWSHTHEGRKLIRYTAVSVISTAVSFFTLFVVFGVLKLWSQVPSTIFANGVATVPSYYLNRNWAWGKSGRSRVMKEMVPFWSMAAFGIAVSVLGAQYAHHLDVEYHMTHLEATAVVLIANVLSFAVFWVLKLLLFNRLFHEKETDVFDKHLTEEEQSSVG